MYSLKCTITLRTCFRYVPPIGLGIIPLLVTLASPVHINAFCFGHKFYIKFLRLPSTCLQRSSCFLIL